MSKKNESNSLVTQSSKQSLEVLPFNIAPEMLEGIAKNFQHINVEDLPIITIPSGAGLTFTIETPEGKKPVESITGTIFAIRHPRGLWLTDSSDGNEPPICSSDDGQTGIYDPASFTDNPEPSGICGQCIYARYSKEMKKTPCKDQTTLYILQDGDPRPQILRLSPTSSKKWRMYLAVLGGISYDACIIEIKLVQETSNAGKKYAVIEPIRKRSLSASEQEFVQFYIKKLSGFTSKSLPVINVPEIEATAGTAAPRSAEPPAPPPEF